MNVQIGKYRIESDARQFVVYYERPKGSMPGQEKPLEGETTEDIVGYYSTIESALKALPSKIAMRADASTLKELVDILNKYKYLVSESLGGA